MADRLKYIAEVLDNNDPDQAGKVQIYIESLMWGFKSRTSACPWAHQDRELTSNIPEIGDKVWVYFDDPAHYRKPFYSNKVDLNSYNSHNQSIGSMSGSYPNIKYIKLKNGVSIAINSSETEVSIVAGDAEIYINPDGQIHIQGSSGSLEFSLLGETTQQLLKDILTEIIAHQHPTAVGPSGPPSNAANFTQLQTVDAEEILSEDVKNS